MAVRLNLRFLAAPSLMALCTGACSQPGGGGLEPSASGPPEPSRVIFQAVDAGTGGALTDASLTVRHLARFPITLDEAGSEVIPAGQAHAIEHAVAHDSLVLEVRLEADSYHRVDTVFSVPRGGSAGPLTVRMTRRLDGTAAGDGGTAPGAGEAAASTPAGGVTLPPAGGGGAVGAPTAGAPSPTGPPGGAAPGGGDPDAGMDRGPILQGDRAFGAGQWAQAVAAYRTMPEPERRVGSYAREYTQALVRLGESELNLGNAQGARAALERAVTFDAPGYRATLLLSRARCATGELAGGRQALDQLQRTSATVPQAERAGALAMVEYHRGLCSQAEAQAVNNPRELLRAGTGALAEYQAFLDQAGALSNRSAEITAAMEDARRRQDAVRALLRGGS